MKKRNVCMLLAAALSCSLLLTACGGGGVSAFDATKYIQGLLDKTYLGEFDEYMNVVDITENECEDDYISGLESEAEDNNVEVYISFLRKKLNFLGSSVTIGTVRKVGYFLEAPLS